MWDSTDGLSNNIGFTTFPSAGKHQNAKLLSILKKNSIHTDHIKGFFLVIYIQLFAFLDASSMICKKIQYAQAPVSQFTLLFTFYGFHFHLSGFG